MTLNHRQTTNILITLFIYFAFLPHNFHCLGAVYLILILHVLRRRGGGVGGLICFLNSQQQKNVCVCSCLGFTRWCWGMLCVMCVWLAGVPTICQASIPVSHHASLSAFLSVCHSFVFRLSSFWLLHLFICIPCVYLWDTHWLQSRTQHTHTHTPSTTIFTLSLQRQRALENTKAHISVLFWSDCIRARSDGFCLFSLTAFELMSLFSQSAEPRCTHTDGC